MMQSISDKLDQFQGKKILVRCNFDVPLSEGSVLDTTRIEDAIETIQLIAQAGASVILLAHAGRPDGSYDASLSLEPVGKVLSSLLDRSVDFVPYVPNIESLKLPNAPIILVDNLRFWPGEVANDQVFAQTIATWGDYYVNESFATCHRAHASIVGIPTILEGFAGKSFEREVHILTNVRDTPELPLVVVIGGAKLETKEPLIDVFAPVASHILVGGKLALDMKGRTDLPENVHVGALLEDGRDITPEQAMLFADYIARAKTIIWNGSMGVTEEEEHREGTRIVGEAITTTPAYTVVGGGDTEAALTVLQLEHGIDHISTGGGAMLALLSRQALPGLAALS